MTRNVVNVLLFISLLSIQTRAFPVRIIQSVGEVALDNVEGLASVVGDSGGKIVNTDSRRKRGVAGLGGSVMKSSTSDVGKTTTDPQVWTALANLERDSEYCILYTSCVCVCND